MSTTASDVTERLRRRDEARRAALEQQRLEKEKTTVQEHTTSYFTEEFTKRRKSIEGKWLPCKIKIMQLSYLYYYRSAGRGTWRLTWSFAAALAPYKQWPSGAAEIPHWLHPIPDCTRCPHLTRGITSTYYMWVMWTHPLFPMLWCVVQVVVMYALCKQLAMSASRGTEFHHSYVSNVIGTVQSLWYKQL